MRYLVRGAVRRGGDRVRVVRVHDQRPDFLNYVSGNGLRPGVRLLVVARDEPGQALQVRAEGGGALTLGLAAAAKLAVERVEAPPGAG